MSETLPAPAPAPTPTPTPTTPAPAPTTPSWYEGKVSPEHVSLWQSKNWDASDPVKLADAVSKSYRELERHVGVPANEIVRLPKAGDVAAEKQFWQRFGAPGNTDGYNLADVKFADGSELRPEFVFQFKELANQLNLPADKARSVVEFMTKHMDSAETQDRFATHQQLMENKANLANLWGPNFDANKFIAVQAAPSLGIDAETVGTLENALGYDKVMEFFRQVGVKIGEDKYVTGLMAPTDTAMTGPEAETELNRLKSDKEWVKKHFEGDPTVRQQFARLTSAIAAAKMR